jgi:hypothetical protein
MPDRPLHLKLVRTAVSGDNFLGLFDGDLFHTEPCLLHRHKQSPGNLAQHNT